MNRAAGSEAHGTSVAIPRVEGIRGHRTELDPLNRHTPLVGEVADVLLPLDVDVADARPHRGTAVPVGAFSFEPGLVDADLHGRRRVALAEVARRVAVIVKLAGLELPRRQLDDGLDRAAALSRDLGLQLKAGLALELPLISRVLLNRELGAELAAHFHRRKSGSGQRKHQRCRDERC